MMPGCSSQRGGCVSATPLQLQRNWGATAADGLAMLPLILGLLLGAGSVMLGCGIRGGGWCTDSPSATVQPPVARGVRQLQAAHDMLMAYAIVYADVYGAASAGPGHLPCPDLDPPDDGNPSNDGPDPPCGAGSSKQRSLGRMPRLTYVKATSASGVERPRHVAFNARRDWRDQRLWYRVSEAFVNNPVHTRVNPDTRSELRVNDEEVVAVIVDPGARDTTPDRGGKAILTGPAAGYLEWQHPAQTRFETAFEAGSNDVLVGLPRDRFVYLVTRRVQGWVERQLRDAASYRCAPVGDVKRTHSPQACYPQQLDFTDTDCVASDCAFLYFHAGDVRRRHARDHWFVRNRWHHYIDYNISPACRAAAAYPCRVSAGPKESGFAIRIER